MRKIRDLLEVFLFFFFTVTLYALFLLNLPLFREPHGLLLTNELSDFSSTQIISYALFASAVICALQGVLMMNWFPVFTAGMASNLWATTFFLLWVDSMFTLSVQAQSFHFLAVLALGLLFLYLFFFFLHYLDASKEQPLVPEGAAFKVKLLNYWMGIWMVFYFLVSTRLLLDSHGYPEFQLPLSMGFCALCFLNYLLFLFMRKSKGEEIRSLSRIGRIFFVCWFLGIVVVGAVQKWAH